MTEDTKGLEQLSRCVAAPRDESREVVGNESGRAELTVEGILAWADAHHAAHGTWPQGGLRSASGAVAGVPGESWQAINHALALGLRGLPGDSSLAELLAEHRGAPPPDMGPQALAEKIWAWEQEQFPIKRSRIRVRVLPERPALSIPEILAWADAHHASTGTWPSNESVEVLGAPGETWSILNRYLTKGGRGLPGGQSLARVLAEHRAVPNRYSKTPLTIERILAWADAYHAATGRWPHIETGPVDPVLAPGETWRRIHTALTTETRGLVGKTSLARLLIEQRGQQVMSRLPGLTEEQILTWADAHHVATGKWPSLSSGAVAGETWLKLGIALKQGSRGLPGGSSLARLLEQHRGHRNMWIAPPLTHDQILAWADAHHAAHGRWPNADSGPVAAAPGETWRGIAAAMQNGWRGLSRGMTLARLLVQQRGHRDKLGRPKLTFDRILAWADAHRAAHGRWPTNRSGPVTAAPGETWVGIIVALKAGGRGLSGGTTLARLLALHRGHRHRAYLPPLTLDQILTWIGAHHAAHGQWPGTNSGPVAGAPGETWKGIERALKKGLRGLSGGMKLVDLLVQHRGHRNTSALHPLTVDQILSWADAHHAACGRWPTNKSGPVGAAPGETWAGIATALDKGGRGLSGGMSLARLLEQHRGYRNKAALPPLTVDQILAWADAHHAAHGRWPGAASGPVVGAPGQTWAAIIAALVEGGRGLSGGTSLARLLALHRDYRHKTDLPPLTVDQVLAWADAHHAAHGRWPSKASGPVAGAPGETWVGIEFTLKRGRRGLSSGMSLARLLEQHRGHRNKATLPTLTHDQILAWADAHHAAHGRWPSAASGPVAAAPGETWEGIAMAMHRGRRGLSGGMSLAGLLDAHRRVEQP